MKKTTKICSNNNNNNNNLFQRRNSRFSTISSLCHEQSPTRTLKWPGHNRVQISCNTSSGHHVRYVVLRATWYEGTAHLLTMTEFKSHLFDLYLLAEPLPMKVGANWSTRRKPLAMSFRKCHILKPEYSSPTRDSNPHNSIGGR